MSQERLSIIQEKLCISLYIICIYIYIYLTIDPLIEKRSANTKYYEGKKGERLKN